MPDYLRLARLAGCDQPVLNWLAAAAEIAAGLSDLRTSDWPRRRAAALELSDALARRFTAPGPADCRVSEYRVPTRSGQITVVHYRPPGRDGPRTAHLGFHGGGFVLGSVHESINDRLWRTRAMAGGVDIFDVDYRLAPEHPFPAAVEDGLDALSWLLDQASDFGIDPARIGVGGGSAGGNLAALVAVHARDQGIRLDHQVLEVPAADLHIEDDESYRDYCELNDLGGELAALRTAYLGAPGTAGGWPAPADVPDLTDLPPALVITAEFDPLRDCGTAYAARLAAAGVPVRTWCAPRQLHGSGALTATSPVAREWQRRIGTFLRSRSAAAAATSS
ncbi:alpha/beta hydrolase fold domain-containing protein [Nocardia sp. NPDC050712]|uniref:alpha/beta hydrolase fold domain-containing protein n=1 Tax=Nocardia sp. NPDC050712 TaxID=3155518 RepID=UPI0033C9283D